MPFIKDKIFQASDFYSECLNKTSISKHIQNLIGTDNTNIIIIPYTYFKQNSLQYESSYNPYIISSTHRKKRQRMNNNQIFTDDLIEIQYPTALLNYNTSQQNIQEISNIYKQHIVNTTDNITNIYNNNQHKTICGMISVELFDNNDLYTGDHYVCYIIKNKVLYYFDSAIDISSYKNNETYRILKNCFNNIKLIKTNKCLFQPAGGISIDNDTYIAQNIFCHSWCLWFIYNFIVNKKTINMIDHLGSFNANKKYCNKLHLILIKTFIFKKLLYYLNLEYIKSDSKFKYFNFIIDESNNFKCINILNE